jgi:hypothetical protein
MDRRRESIEDTDPEAHAAQNEAYRRMGGTGRVAVMFRLTTLARASATAGIAARHPEYDHTQRRMALFRLIYGDDLARAVWRGSPLVDP